MARPIKTGLEYYPMDVDFIDDTKVIFIEGKCGLVGVEVLRRLLDEIYRNGYYTSYNETTAITLAVRLRCDINLLTNVVSAAETICFFNPEQLKKNKILTSKGIQERYIQATLKRKIADINPSFRVSNSITDSVTAVSDAESTQSKGEESKGEESKFKPLKNFPSIKITEAEFSRLQKKYSDSNLRISEGLKILEIYASTNPRRFNRYTSHNKVLHGWVFERAKENMIKELKLETQELIHEQTLRRVKA